MKSYIHHQREVIISLFGKDNDWNLTGRSSYEILIKHFKIKFFFFLNIAKIYTIYTYKIDRVNFHSIVANSVYCKSSVNSTIAFHSEHLLV